MSEKELNYSNLKVVWEWLCSKYDFKRDIVKNRIVWKEAGKEEDYKILTDEQLNTIAIEAGFAGLKSCSPANISLFLFSHYTDTFHPIREYLNKVSIKRKRSIISQLCRCIKTTNDVAFEKFFTKWLASSVANAVNDLGCQNHTCLTFTGGQFAGKTTFFEWLCPPLLKDYIYTGEIDLHSKDSLWKLSEYWFVNLEEQIKALNKADANTMKHLITLPHIKGRKPYGRLEAQGYRLANFLASSNDDDFLTDPTGSRRYLCFRILKIDNVGYNKINIDDLWSEAFHYYKENPTSYFVDSKDIEELTVNNQEFVSVTQEQEYVNNFFSKPKERQPFYLMPSTVIRDFLRLETGNQILKDRAIGIALKNNGFAQISHRFGSNEFPVKVWKLALNNKPAHGTISQYEQNSFTND